MTKKQYLIQLTAEKEEQQYYDFHSCWVQINTEIECFNAVLAEPTLQHKIYKQLIALTPINEFHDEKNFQENIKKNRVSIEKNITILTKWKTFDWQTKTTLLFECNYLKTCLNDLEKYYQTFDWQKAQEIELFE